MIHPKHDEYLEALWRLQEKDQFSTDDLKAAVQGAVEIEVIHDLVADGMVRFDSASKRIALSERGREFARNLIRKHRLAERLLHDVLDIREGPLESEACSFEHVVAPQVVDSICTLLGHPRECPHGMPIPEGDCCGRSLTSMESSVVPLSELAVGEGGRVAYVNFRNDAQRLRLNGLQINPGVRIVLRQRFPSYVLECEGGMIVLDAQIATAIRLWKEKTSVPRRG